MSKNEEKKFNEIRVSRIPQDVFDKIICDAKDNERSLASQGMFIIKQYYSKRK